MMTTMAMMGLVDVDENREPILLKTEPHSCGFSPSKVLLEIPWGGDSGALVIIINHH